MCALKNRDEINEGISGQQSKPNEGDRRGTKIGAREGPNKTHT